MHENPPGHWSATLSLGKYDRIFIAKFEDPEEAAVARDRVALSVLGRDAKLNFPRRRLRAATVAEIRAEILRKRKKRTSSRYVGVSWKASSGRWVAHVRYEGAPRELGTFTKEKDAAVARDRVALHTSGKRARLNFPATDLEPASFEAIKRELERSARAKQASRFRGVHYHQKMVSAGRPWGAKIRTFVELGYWATEEDAALAYDRAALYYYGDRARLNRPRAARRAGSASPHELQRDARNAFKRKAASRYRGVSWHVKGKWVARIRFRYVLTTLGYFASEEEAAVAYDRAAVKAWGLQAKLNFHPRTGEALYGQRLGDPLRRGAPAPPLMPPVAV